MIPAARSPPSTVGPSAERVLSLDDDGVGSVADALSSATSRAVLRRLGHAPAPASTVAEAVGESIQTVGYHLDRLDAAGLVRVVDTRYSPKGREMDVYAPVPVTIVCESTDRQD
jgi:DNA-binding transcriptional ArsR family regulator